MKALHDIAIMKVAERDIYLAYYTLDRLETVPKTVGYLYKAKKFLEGAISMVKKKFKEGISHLDELAGDQELHEVLRPLVYSYRAFGNFSEGNIEQAVADYEHLKNHFSISPGDQYNNLLCQGIQKANLKKWEEAYLMFTQAQKMNSSKIEPKFYLAVDFLDPDPKNNSFH